MELAGANRTGPVDVLLRRPNCKCMNYVEVPRGYENISDYLIEREKHVRKESLSNKAFEQILLVN